MAVIADQPVATAASDIPVLSTLVAQVQAAGLVETLNSAEDITVFAPVNDAFAAVPAATLKSLTDDPTGALANVLKYHVVAGQLSPAELPGKHTTLEGQDIMVTGSGENFTINDTAKVVCGNVTTANATVYVIDGVLVPPAS
ncbi:MAG: putative surface protein with fasciclin (FAS1) repeats [Actinomycetes bacterium]